MSKGIGGHHRPNQGATDVWLTPPHVLKALGRFELDPCAAPDPRPWDTADLHYVEHQDGLSKDWGTKRVWLNPPYGPQTKTWVKRLADHGRGTALIFARTEVEFWHVDVFPRADALLFLRGRLFFHYPDGRRAPANGGAPSVLIAYGQLDATILGQCGLPGQFIDLTKKGVPTRC